MSPNPYLSKLGFSSTDRVAIVHTDDIGMCQATLPAISDLLDFGIVTSAAIMVPCPWFQGAAQYAREHPGDVPLYLCIAAAEGPPDVIRAGSRFKVRVCEDSLTAFAAIVGWGNAVAE